MTAPARVAAALAVLALLLLGPLRGAGVGEVRATGELPPCRYDDLLTSPRGYADWRGTLVDPILSVPRTYVPPDLVPVTEAGLPGAGKSIRAIAVDDLRAMAEAARAAGAPIGVESAYRSYAEQETLYQGWQRNGTNGGEESNTAPARPGHSEHQLGVAIDFNNAAPDARAGERFGTTRSGAWMAQHAWSFGWLLSYPGDAGDRTCYTGEPWHYRYVGRELAAQIHESGLTVREYLWARFTATIVPMPPGAPFGLAGSSPGLPLVTLPPSPTPAVATPAPPGSLPPLDAPSPSPGSTDSPAPSQIPTPALDPSADDAAATVAGQAVVIGAIVIAVGSLAAVWLGLRRRRPEGP